MSVCALLLMLRLLEQLGYMWEILGNARDGGPGQIIVWLFLCFYVLYLLSEKCQLIDK